MDVLNEFLECTCGRCDDGRCQCSAWEDEFQPVIAPYDDANYDANYDEYIDNLNDWD